MTPDTFEPLAEVPYRQPGWLRATGGVVSVDLDEDQSELARDHPLALVTHSAMNPGVVGSDLGHGIVAIRESADGLFVGAEPLIHRLDPGQTSTVTFFARRYGAPLGGVKVDLAQLGRIPGQGGSGQTSGPNIPSAPIPDMGVPETALQLPAEVETGADGAAEAMLTGADPGNPRSYLDGQLYLVDFRLPGQGNAARQPFDYVVVHVRDAIAEVANPTWEDVGPILTQYANLYPVMGEFVNLKDPDDILANRSMLSLAFSLPIDDPNYMPVERDLSAAKLDLILRWLDQPLSAAKQGAPSVRRGGAPPAAFPSDSASTTSDSKTKFAAAFRAAQLGRADR